MHNNLHSYINSLNLGCVAMLADPRHGRLSQRFVNGLPHCAEKLDECWIPTKGCSVSLLARRIVDVAALPVPHGLLQIGNSLLRHAFLPLIESTLISNGQSARLARLMGSPITTVRSWAASGSSEARKRVMNPSARRLLFVLLALQREGHDLDEIRAAARRLEREYLDEESI